MRSRLLLPIHLLMIAALGFGLSACSSKDTSSATPTQRLDAALAVLAKADAVKVSMATDKLPSAVSTGLLSTTGTGTYAPAFTGSVKLSVGGLSVDTNIISVDGKLWAKGGLIPKWTPIQPSSVNAPDPAKLVGTGKDSGFLGLYGSTTGLKAGKKVRDGGTVLTSLTGELPADKVAALLPTADPAGTYRVTYRLTDADRLQDASLTGPVYKGAPDVTYKVTLLPQDSKPTITTPTN